MRIFASGRKTHYFNAEMTVELIEHIKQCFRLKRAEIRADNPSVDISSLHGALLWDAFSGAAQKLLQSIRERMATNADIRIIGPDHSIAPVKGGWSGDNQPNDGWHNFCHNGRTAAQQAIARRLPGQTRTPTSAIEYPAEDMDADLYTSLVCDMFAIENMNEDRIAQAWRERGWISLEEQANYIK